MGRRGMVRSRRLPKALVVGLLALPACASAAEAGGLEFSGSGFLTLAAGKILGGRALAEGTPGYGCPCFVADYAQAGVYEGNGWSFGPDSRLGLQATASTVDGRYSVTGQVVARGSTALGATRLEWLYASVELDGETTLQVGRKRLPLFIHSEAQDVGFALPWIHLPPQLYGWEVVNYNGASLNWRGEWFGWAPAVQVFGGSEDRDNAGYWKLYNGRSSRTDSRWSDILGSEWSVTRHGLSARLVRIQSYTRNRVQGEGGEPFSDRKRQIIDGLSLGIERDSWFARSEFLYIDRHQDYGKDYARLHVLGYRHGPWQPVLSYTRYRQQLNVPGAAAEGHQTWSFVLRYDLTESSALKFQADFWKDRSDAGFPSMHGDARLLTFSYDKVF